MERDNGGPAFPIAPHTADDGISQVTYPGSDGLSIRDYFAAKAMQAAVARLFDLRPYGDVMEIDGKLAQRAYDLADAMLEQRKK